MSMIGNLFGPWKGFTVTFRQMFKPKVTTRYPKVKRVKPQRFHGRHVLNRYPDGMEKCIGCELCAGACPARCIYVRGADNPPDDPVSPGERFGFIYEINMLRCIFCGLCVEACPTEAITMTHLFEMSVTGRDEGVFTKDSLLVNPDGTPNHPLPDTPLIDVNELKLSGGWMRATASSGRAAFEGIEAWSPSAGMDGTAPAEPGQTASSDKPQASSTEEEAASFKLQASSTEAEAASFKLQASSTEEEASSDKPQASSTEEEDSSTEADEESS